MLERQMVLPFLLCLINLHSILKRKVYLRTALSNSNLIRIGPSSLYSEITGRLPVIFYFERKRNMNKRVKSAKVFNEFVERFRCPHCKGPLKVVDLTSLKCTNNHTFDFAKHGYVNLMSRSSKSHYDKKLFEESTEKNYRKSEVIKNGKNMS